MKILYYDCFFRLSGDMHLGAMIDIGVDQDKLLGELKKLAIDPYEINQQGSASGISGTRVDVILSNQQARPPQVLQGYFRTH